MQLKKGDIVAVQFGDSKSTKTLALIEKVHVVVDGPSNYSVLYNDGTRGTGCTREILIGSPISPDDVMTLLLHTFRHLDSMEFFEFLIELREIATQYRMPHGGGITITP